LTRKPTPIQKRIEREVADDIDEEFELELDDVRLDQLLADADEHLPGEGLDRRVYFKELLRLQGELIKLQDWVAYNQQKVVSCLKAAMPPERVESSSALLSASIPASAESQHCLRRTSANEHNGTSSAMPRTCRPVARSYCSIAAGITAPGSSA